MKNIEFNKNIKPSYFDNGEEYFDDCVRIGGIDSYVQILLCILCKSVAFLQWMRLVIFCISKLQSEDCATLSSFFNCNNANIAQMAIKGEKNLYNL